jgi:hypothetical protein
VVAHASSGWYCTCRRFDNLLLFTKLTTTPANSSDSPLKIKACLRWRDPSSFYDEEEFVEDLGEYGPGGYHPVILGDVLPKALPSKEPQYRVMQKLGYGVFATIRLARDIVGSL